jgi:hypothetical protein
MIKFPKNKKIYMEKNGSKDGIFITCILKEDKLLLCSKSFDRNVVDIRDFFELTLEEADEQYNLGNPFEPNCIDKRSVWEIVNQEGSLLGCDSVCEKYGIDLPYKSIRYNMLYVFLCWYSASILGRRLGRWMNRRLKNETY